MKIINDINDKNQTDILIKAVIIEAEALVTSLKALKRATQLNIDGWSVYESGSFFKSSKRINGKICSVHLGRVFDRSEATKKIKAWELANLEPDQPVEELETLVADPPVDDPGNLEPDQPVEELENLIAEPPMEEPGNLVADPPVDARECRMLIDHLSCPGDMEGGEK